MKYKTSSVELLIPFKGVMNNGNSWITLFTWNFNQDDENGIAQAINFFENSKLPERIATGPYKLCLRAQDSLIGLDNEIMTYDSETLEKTVCEANLKLLKESCHA